MNMNPMLKDWKKQKTRKRKMSLSPQMDCITHWKWHLLFTLFILAY